MAGYRSAGHRSKPLLVSPGPSPASLLPILGQVSFTSPRLIALSCTLSSALHETSALRRADPIPSVFTLKHPDCQNLTRSSGPSSISKHLHIAWTFPALTPVIGTAPSRIVFIQWLNNPSPAVAVFSIRILAATPTVYNCPTRKSLSSFVICSWPICVHAIAQCSVSKSRPSCHPNGGGIESALILAEYPASAVSTHIASENETFAVTIQT
ncbi:unnamed protein product [Somion occarium]|uniref:Uncharacterized protein n=1 Tax=Somion occarium TaxID=3059160 RepID=A0ABP1CTZ0_9APHY